MLRTLKNLFLSAALLALVAAAFAGSVAPGSFLRTDPYTLVTGSDYEPWCEDGDAASVPEADLRGPHFALSLECLFQRTAIPEAQAMLNDKLASMPPAAPGTEFLFAIVAGQATFVPDYSEELALSTAWIESGAERFSLNDLAGNDFIVLSVPSGERAVLWVEDEGRAQGLDLRTGAQVDPVEAYYGGPNFGSRTLDGYDYDEVRFNGAGGWSWIMSCDHDRSSMRRAVWSGDYGWAAEGSVLIEVGFWWCGTSFSDTEWALDTDQALQLRSGSEWYEPVTHLESFDSDSPGWEHHTFIFEVPADVAEVTAFFSPIGEITQKDNGKVFTLDKDPDYTHWTATF